MLVSKGKTSMSDHGGEMEYGDGLFKSRRVPSVNTILHDDATERGRIKYNEGGFFCALL